MFCDVADSLTHSFEKNASSVLIETHLATWDSLKRRLVYKASKPQSRTAEINFGFMSAIVYDRGLQRKLNFFDKMGNTENI